MRTFARIALAATLLTACGGDGVVRQSGPLLLPTHLKKITVQPFVNKTQFFGLEDKLRRRVEGEFIRDGRLVYVNAETDADAILSGEIVNYIKQVVTFDANNQDDQYKLWVVLNARLTDRASGNVIWEESRLSQEYIYYVETRPGGLTEEEARETLWDLFARDLVKRTFDGYGSVSGLSEKVLPAAPPPLQGDRPAPETVEPSTATVPSRPREAPPSPY
jgi:hypothetical protein